ncbi:hypothetical protein GDO78_006012, partial [Eleutherodactylus coqui]
MSVYSPTPGGPGSFMCRLPRSRRMRRQEPAASVPKEEIDNEERQIVVWVGQEEKVISGLTKHTTCEDVVEALLEEYQVLAENNNVRLGSHKEYCILESWKDFKRILPPSLQMLKLLKSWGAEEISVKFFLFKPCTLYPFSMWWTSQNSITPPFNNCKNQHNVVFHVQDFPLDMRKRIVRKAFRKLQKMKKDMNYPKETNIQQLIHVIMSQNSIMKQQMDRMKEVDNQLEAYDSCQQQLENCGCNEENDGSCMKADDDECHSVDGLPEIHDTKNLTHIEDTLNYQFTLIRKLSDEIKMEMSSMCIQEDEDFVKEELSYKETSVKQGIDESLQVGLRLHSLNSYIQTEIQYNNSILLQQRKEYEILKQELKSVCASNSDSSLCDTPQQYMSSDVSSNKAVRDISALLSSTDIQNDTDSDTGISSTHSQDLELI